MTLRRTWSTKSFKFSNSHIMNMTFKQTDVAQKALASGLKLFHMRVPRYDVKEEYIPLRTCFKCYVVEDHSSSECTNKQTYKICSECAEPGHLWQECISAVKRCVNCEGTNRTLASQCPKRKEALAKRQSIKEAKKKRPSHSLILTAGQPRNPCPPNRLSPPSHHSHPMQPQTFWPG